MKGLILKDILNLKRHSKYYMILMGFYFILGVASEDFVMFGSMIIVFSAILPITAISYDEKNNWDSYALTMPIARTDLIISRYILGMIFLTLSFLITVILTIAFGSGAFKESILESLAILAVGIILMSVIFPVIFKYGVEKGRNFMMMVLLAPTGAIILFSKLGFTLPDIEAGKMLLYSLPAVTLTVLTASILISVSIYKKKEF